MLNIFDISVCYLFYERLIPSHRQTDNVCSDVAGQEIVMFLDV